MGLRFIKKHRFSEAQSIRGMHFCNFPRVDAARALSLSLSRALDNIASRLRVIAINTYNAWCGEPF
jgi:hypothetical protein